jgi:hypothetical protein
VPMVGNASFQRSSFAMRCTVPVPMPSERHW